MSDLAYPTPPSCIPADMLSLPAQGSRVCVAGLVQVRQRPGTAKGVVFITLEDETGCVNVVVWKRVFERFRRTIMTARLMRVTGRLQREGSVIHVVADTIEDISSMLDDVFSGAIESDEASPS
ncbi:MAG: OB-fold nucleic acid binding domain-containing protein [Rhodobacteraceae bacterium]|nr:OB-fold nucleic acid binding domain-containing protein [Paracoccaceae bacterium]